MPDKILHKRNLTTGNVPSTASLEPGELAINVADGKLFLRQSGSIANQIVTQAKITSGTGIITGVTAGFGLATSDGIATYGTRVIIGASAGTGSAQLARGDHTHTAS